jgi:hypothetical protein
VTLHIPLSPEAEARLVEHAAAAGQDITEFVLEEFEERLAVTDASPTNGENMAPNQWIVELDAWVASHRQLDHHVDDSRESIYAGRGE